MRIADTALAPRTKIGMSAGRNLEPSIIIIFGITGDLAQRFLLPALYHLIKDNLLPEKTTIVGLSRREVAAEHVLDKAKVCISEEGNICDPATIETMQKRLRMIKLDPTEAEDYSHLRQFLNEHETEQGVCMNRLFYLAIPPQVYGTVVRHLGEQGLGGTCQHGTASARLLVEKPFGYDLTSAEELISATAKRFKPSQVFRVDHYLAKETVQNILTFRRQNHVFASLWNRQHIDSISIHAFEQLGIEGRADFYEQTGALRDLIQSHLMQLLALTTMELPEQFTSASIHRAKQAVLEAVQPPSPALMPKKIIRGQYASYRQEAGKPRSETETYCSLELSIDNDTWRGVPVRLATGKKMTAKSTAIVVHFKSAGSAPANVLTFRIQPNEGIGLTLCVKKPEFEHDLQEAAMDFSYQRTFNESHVHPDAYERVLVDAVRGDHTLFATDEEVLESWRTLQPILDYWARTDDLLTYPDGSAGPRHI